MAFVGISNKDFSTLRSFKDLLRSSLPLLVAALGQTPIILTGRIDLPLGGVVTLCNAVCVMSMNSDPAWGSIPALGAVAAVGLACGVVNGVPVIKGRLAPIIVTITTTVVFDGMTLLLMPDPGGSMHKAFAKFLTWEHSGAVPFLLFILILYLVGSLANSTPHGEALRAIGDNENTTYSTGIRVGKIKFCAYCLVGLLCAVAGVFLNARMSSADATIGKNHAVNAITAMVVGKTAMTGTMGNLLGTIAGVFIISVIDNMLSLFDAPSFCQFICQDLVPIAALSFSALHKRH